MKYPINEELFLEKWLGMYKNPDEGDVELGLAMVRCINRAYEIGMKEGYEAGIKARMDGDAV